MFNYSNIISHGFANFRQILLAFCMIVGGYFRSANDETTTEPILSSNTEEKIKLLLKKNGINYLRFTSPIVVLSQILDLISLLTLKIKIIQDKDKYTLLKNIQNLLEKFDDFDDRSKLLKEYNKRFLNHYQKDKKIEEFIQSIKKDIKSISEKISSIVFNEKEEIEHLIEQIDIRIDSLTITITDKQNATIIPTPTIGITPPSQSNYTESFASTFNPLSSLPTQ